MSDMQPASQASSASEAPPPASAAATGTPGMGYIKAYVGVYLLLFALFVVHSLTSCEALKPVAFLHRAFPNLDVSHPAGVTLEALRNAFDPKKGHVRLWEDFSFEDSHKRRIQIPQAARLSRTEAVLLAQAILHDMAGPEDKASIKELQLYREAWTANLPWPYLMTIYNIAGLFLMLIVFLRQPIRAFLEQNAQQTREALARTRAAETESETLKQRHAELLKEIETEHREMQKAGQQEQNKERERVVKAAKHEAEGMVESLKASLDAEVASAAERLRAEVAREAVDQARVLIEKHRTDTDHTDAVDAFLKDLKQTKLS